MNTLWAQVIDYGLKNVEDNFMFPLWFNKMEVQVSVLQQQKTKDQKRIELKNAGMKQTFLTKEQPYNILNATMVKSLKKSILHISPLRSQESN